MDWKMGKAVLKRIDNTTIPYAPGQRRPMPGKGKRNDRGIKYLNMVHGRSKTSLYNRWMTMLARCHNPNNKKFKRYGGRGIKVCLRWHGFQNFANDMGEPPTLKHSLDRIDNNGNYEKENCRWTSQKIQQNNRTNNRKLTFHGKTLVVTEWARRVGISHRIIIQRIDRDGWSTKRALTTKTSRSRNPKLTEIVIPKS